MRDIILYFANKYFGDWERIYDAIEKQEDVDFDELDIIKEEIGDEYVTVLDDDYPKELKLIDRPPFVLFFKGKKELLNKPNKLWYFGNYKTEEYEKIWKDHKDEADKNEITIVSGYTSSFERGYINTIDAKNIILVRDSGIDSYINMTKIEESYFTKENLIISEYPNKVIPSLHTWEISARIKSGLSKWLLLSNSIKEKITFKFISDTIDQNRKIYCYSNAEDERSHNSILISKGAYAITNITNIKEGK